MKRSVMVWAMIMCLVMHAYNFAAGENLSDPDMPVSGNGESQRYYIRLSSRDGVDEFLSLIGEIHGDSLLSGADFSPETCFNVTPERVAEETDIRIFQYNETATSFALVDGEVYEICRWFGGWGFFDAYPWDYDGDGQTDLLIASSWGSGLHRAELSVFNRATKEITVIHDTTEDGLCYHGEYDLCFSGIVAPDPHEDNGIIAVGVDYVQFVLTENEDDYRFEICGPYGVVLLENGIPVFRSFSQP